MKKTEFIEIVPQYPLSVPIYYKEDYYTWPVLMMKKKGYGVKIITLKKRGQKEKEFINGIEIIRFTNILSLFLYVLQKRESLFYAQGKIFPLFTGLLAKKSIYITHATMGQSLPKYLSNPCIRFVYKFCLSRFKKVITISPYETTLLTKLGFKNNLVYILNAIDCNFFSKPYGGNEFNKKYKLTIKSKKIIFLGNMHQGDKTNIETLFKALKIVLEKFPDSKLIIIGQFPKKIKELNEFLPIAKSVLFTGWLPHLEFIKAFDIADVFVNTSRYEGNPLSVGEAASAKIPICLSNLPTLRSIYKKSVLYHNPADYKQLAKNIVRLLSDSALGRLKAEDVYRLIKNSSNITKIKPLLLMNIFKILSEKDADPLQNEWDRHWGKSNIDYSIKQIQYEDFFTRSFLRLFRSGETILEAGCGYGRYCFWLEDQGRKAVGIDIVQKAITTGNTYAKNNGYKSKLYVGSVCALPFKDNTFDGYISLGVIEHFRTKEEVQSAFTEAYRVLKLGGKAFFVVPNPIAVHMLVERLMKAIGIHKGLTHYPMFKKDLLYYSQYANFSIIDAGTHDFYFPIYSIITLVLRRDIWLLKDICKKILNVCDYIPFLREFGSGLYVTVQKTV